jgi:hypothetical protein
VRVEPSDAAMAIERSRARSWLGVGVAFGVLNLPKLGAGATVLAQIRPRRFWPIDLSAAYWFDNEAELLTSETDLGLHPLVLAPFPSGGSRSTFRAIEAKAALCPLEHNLRSGSILACAGIQGGLLFVSSEGFVADEDENRPRFGFEAYARWHFQLWDPIGISYSAGVFVPVLRDKFGYVDNFGVFRELFQVSPIGGRLDIALTYSF